jgi:hypothetical protein
VKIDRALQTAHERLGARRELLKADDQGRQGEVDWRRQAARPQGHHRVRDACGAWNRRCLLIKLIQSMNPHVFGLFFPVSLERPNE